MNPKKQQRLHLPAETLFINLLLEIEFPNIKAVL